MTNAAAPGTRMRGAFLLADISGYTGFLQGVADAHRELINDTDAPPAAYGALSSLLDAMVEVVSPSFELVKFEGDAIFAVANDGTDSPRGAAVVECLRACYAAFSKKLAVAKTDWTCTCNSCSALGGLGLKFVLHHGEYVTQRIVGREELAARTSSSPIGC